MGRQPERGHGSPERPDGNSNCRWMVCSAQDTEVLARVTLSSLALRNPMVAGQKRTLPKGGQEESG
jgi:hypothetical protein